MVVGLSGCTATGKSTLLLALQEATPVTIISCDDFYKPKADCPVFDLDGLPWPSGSTPAAFSARGNADLNVPESVQWDLVYGAVEAAAAETSDDSGTVVVDSMLLFGEHPGAARVRELCDQTCVLWCESGQDALDELRRRKYTRSAHLGKPSYEQRGVSAADYQVYFEQYVWPSWLKHGASRAPADTLRIDCMQPTTDQVQQLMATGWFG